jgi:hypothetical protein
VSITYNGEDDSPGEKLWLTTTTLPNTIVNTKSVISNQQNRDTLEDRIVAAGEAKYGDIDLYATEGIGVDGLEQPLVIIGDGSETLAVANSQAKTLDISDFVTGGYRPLAYEIDDGATIDNGAAVMIGSVLQYTGGTTDGSDTVPVIVTDRVGNTVTVSVVVTVA